jgi:hypothetical protein
VDPVRIDSPDGTPPAAHQRVEAVALGGIIVLVGILTMIFCSVVLGLIITLVGLVAFGGFARGR